MKSKWNAAELVALTSRFGAGGAFEIPFSHSFVRKLMETREMGDIFLPEEKNERIHALLRNLDQAQDTIRRYEMNGIQMLLPDDEQWPQAFKKLRNKEPCYLFVYGNCKLLNAENRISVAGSRDLGETAARAARRAGLLLAKNGYCLVSGCARGTDRFCQKATLEAGGNAVLFPAIPFHEALELEGCRQAIASGKVLIATKTLPEEEFSAAKALSRNHLIYAMGNPALVVAARKEKGGSWKGAMDCLHAGWSTVGVFLGEDADFDGCRELKKYGAEGISVKGKDSELWRKIQSLRIKEEITEQLHF